jgi:phage terminase large subunit-like protein
MQRLHLDDLVGHLLEQEGWTHLNLPAIAETEQQIPVGQGRFYLRRPGEVLHPEREQRAVLDEFKRSMGSLDFAAQYQQEPVAEGGNLIKWDWFKFYQEPPAQQSGDRIIVSWDTALSSKELSSYSACVVLHVKGETAYVLEVIRERLEYPDLKRKVIAVYRQWRNACSRFELVIENKGSGTDSTSQALAWTKQRPRCWGLMEYMRQEAEKLTRIEDVAITTLRTPAGVSTVYTMSGKRIMVSAHGTIEVSETDAGPLIGAGFERV